MPLFADLSDDCMRWVCSQLVEVTLAPGEALVTEGDPVRGFFILVEGGIDALKRTDNGESLPAGHHTAPAFFGEIPLLAQTRLFVTLRAVAPCRLGQLPEAAFRRLLADSPEFSRVIFRTMAERVSGMESFARQRQKMAALGTLAAGLAHELNNPAAAIARVVDRLRHVLDTLYEATDALHVHGLPATACGVLENFRERAEARLQEQVAVDPLVAAEQEDEISDWLGDRGVGESWLLAPTLVAGGIAPTDLDGLVAGVGEENTDAAVRWVASSVELATLLNEAGRGSARISELVKALKSYSYEGQAPRQEVDLHDGIEDTLTILRHKLKHGIEVVRDYDRSLPRLMVYGSELNQVWTNLIDNAADALGGQGTITIRTRRNGEFAVIEVCDDGPGVPPEIQPRIFDPFFTT
ncbi:MAG: cyclic nucleotide-binding domain-containing protein, partial [Betaproteobacteria bacterium]|nr:cyclic nucleotide-binding domain-containing protein [Betaproteobacteria bacterium]